MGTSSKKAQSAFFESKTAPAPGWRGGGMDVVSGQVGQGVDGGAVDLHLEVAVVSGETLSPTLTSRLEQWA